VFTSPIPSVPMFPLRSFVATTLLISLLGSFGYSQTKTTGFPKTAARSAQPIEQRVDQLLKQMTVEEKIGQMMQYFQFSPEISAAEERARKGQVGSYLFVTDPKLLNRLQRAAVEGSRLHIPLIFGFDVIHGWRTIFPVPIGMAASWDPKLIERVQSVAAKEARASGIHWTFAPMVDIARDARWGRMVEGAGEDPYLGSAIARAQVRGFQGTRVGEPEHLLATVKHFAAYGAAEGGRDYDSTYVPDVQLWNVYFPPYKAAIDEGAGSVMSAYQDLNDVPASGNTFLLQDVLRKTWNFDGFVVSDAAAVFNLTTHGFARDTNDAALRAVKAGVDMEMAFPEPNAPTGSPTSNAEPLIPGQHTYDVGLQSLLKSGQITEAVLDARVRPILMAKMKLGLFENPYVDESRTEAVLTIPAHRELARLAAQQSIVLLKNDGQLLPIKKSVRSIAVIGTLADSGKDTLGSWVFVGKPEETVTVLQGIKNKVPSAAVTFVRGAQIRRLFPSPVEPPTELMPPEQSPQDLEQQIADAVSAAKQAEVAIVVLGERKNMSGEAASRSSLDLPGEQERVLKAVVATGKPVVVLMLSGRPLDIRWASDHVPAIVQCWYPGSEGGNAIADVLFGDVNPGGKLPFTWLRSVGQAPLYYAHNLTQEVETKKDFKSRYWDDSSFPLYPFGYGLSYSKFEFSNLRLDRGEMAAGGELHASIDVQNVSDRTGDEVVQLYIHQQAGSASRPMRQLKGFNRVTLAAGEKRTVTFKIGRKELEFWSPQSKQWVVEPERFDVWIGPDSRATTHAEFKIIGEQASGMTGRE
jgi:beta-glucosidase